MITRAPKVDRFRQRDGLPEQTWYEDTGCDISPKCQDCPLARCRYEEPGGLRALLNESRDETIIKERLAGKPTEEIADDMRISRRTVFRVLEGTRGLCTPEGIKIGGYVRKGPFGAEKQCSKCLEWSPADLDHFHKNNAYLQSWCKACVADHDQLDAGRRACKQQARQRSKVAA